MPRASGQKDYLSLIKGLNTESSALTFPEGFTAAELNFVIDKDGLIRKRRLGFEELVETFSVLRPFATVENTFYWRGPSLVCVIITDINETSLRFHAVDDNFTFITEIVIDTTVVKTQIAETTNFLVITTDSGSTPIMCEYKEATKEIFVNSVDIYVRDFELVDDGLGISENPATLVGNDNHKYNIYNSDWHLWRADLEGSKTVRNVAEAYKLHTAYYPSNAEVASVGLIVDDVGDTVFSSKDVDGANFGNSKAARGHYVYDVNNFDRTARLANPLVDGAPSTTLTSLGTVNFIGVPTYDPDDPTNPDNPDGGGREPPYRISTGGVREP